MTQKPLLTSVPILLRLVARIPCNLSAPPCRQGYRQTTQRMLIWCLQVCVSAFPLTSPRSCEATLHLWTDPGLTHQIHGLMSMALGSSHATRTALAHWFLGVASQVRQTCLRITICLLSAATRCVGACSTVCSITAPHIYINCDCHPQINIRRRESRFRPNSEPTDTFELRPRTLRGICWDEVEVGLLLINSETWPSLTARWVPGIKPTEGPRGQKAAPLTS